MCQSRLIGCLLVAVFSFTGCGVEEDKGPGRTDASQMITDNDAGSEVGDLPVTCATDEWRSRDGCVGCDALATTLACSDLDFSGEAGSSRWNGDTRTFDLVLQEGAGEIESATISFVVRPDTGMVQSGESFQNFPSSQNELNTATFLLGNFVDDGEIATVDGIAVSDSCGRSFEVTNAFGVLRPGETGPVSIACSPR